MKWINDQADVRVQEALGWTCDVCNALVKHLCSNTIHPKEPLPGRVIHFGRLVDRNTK